MALNENAIRANSERCCLVVKYISVNEFMYMLLTMQKLQISKTDNKKLLGHMNAYDAHKEVEKIWGKKNAYMEPGPLHTIQDRQCMNPFEIRH